MLLNRERALERMADAQVDAIVAATAENVVYLSDFEMAWAPISFGGRAFAILPRSPDIPACVIVPDYCLAFLAEARSWMPEVRTFGSFGIFERAEGVLPESEFEFSRLLRETEHARTPDPHAALTNSLRDLGLAKGRLGTDDPRIAEVIKGDTDAEVVDAQELFRRIRAVKSPAEIERLRDGTRINEAGIEAALPALREGGRWHEVGEAWDTTVRALGAKPAFWFSGGGSRSAGLFPELDYELGAGDPVRFECGCTYRQYWADTGRTGVVGAPSKRLSEYHDALALARQEVEGLIQPGAQARDLPQRSVEVIRKIGIPHFKGTAWGHGLGLQIYDLPRLTIDSTDILETGMVFALETPYFEIGWGGMQLEDTFLVTDNGAERLTQLPQELLDSGVRKASSGPGSSQRRSAW